MWPQLFMLFVSEVVISEILFSQKKKVYRKEKSFGSVKWISLLLIRVQKLWQAGGHQGVQHEMVTLM